MAHHVKDGDIFFKEGYIGREYVVLDLCLSSTGTSGSECKDAVELSRAFLEFQCMQMIRSRVQGYVVLSIASYL